MRRVKLIFACSWVKRYWCEHADGVCDEIQSSFFVAGEPQQLVALVVHLFSRYFTRKGFVLYKFWDMFLCLLISLLLVVGWITNYEGCEIKDIMRIRTVMNRCVSVKINNECRSRR